MKIKLDENLPKSLAALLRAQGHDVHTVIEEGLQGAADEKVWRTVKMERRFLITQDLDFSGIAEPHAGLLLLRLRAPSAPMLVESVRNILSDLPNWVGCFVVLTENKIRVRRF